MLVITRSIGQTVIFGDNITATVIGVKGNQVRLALNAPKDTPIHREEVYQRIKQEQQQTA